MSAMVEFNHGCTSFNILAFQKRTGKCSYAYVNYIAVGGIADIVCKISKKSFAIYQEKAPDYSIDRAEKKHFINTRTFYQVLPEEEQMELSKKNRKVTRVLINATISSSDIESDEEYLSSPDVESEEESTPDIESDEECLNAGLLKAIVAHVKVLFPCINLEESAFNVHWGCARYRADQMLTADHDFKPNLRP